MTSTRAAHDDPAAQRILLAAERLFAERGFENVSVRDIADEAGVTHPLIYYHWGSKRGLLAAVLERNQSRVRAVAAGESDAREVILAIVKSYLAAGRPYMLTMARGFLDGMPVADWPGGYPGMAAAIRALLDEGPPGDPRWNVEARSAVALLTALLLGWGLMGEQIMDVAELPAASRDGMHERVIAAIDRIIEAALEARPAAGEGG